MQQPEYKTRPPAQLWLALVTALIVVFMDLRVAGQTCAVQSPPPPFGEKGYTGQNGYIFDYAADAGISKGIHYFQLLVTNKGSDPLTFDWENASFFRRGAGAGVEVRSQCRSDGNAPNVLHGLIKYGPNTQFAGPDARFYHYQQRQVVQVAPETFPNAVLKQMLSYQTASARPAAGAPAQANAPAQPVVNNVNFAVKWGAFLDTGAEYLVSFTVSAVRVGESVKYEFSNDGAPVQIDWPAILSPAVLQVARLQNAPRPVVVNDRLALPAGNTSVMFSITGAGPATTIPAPLSVYTPEDLLLYRDVFTGLRFVSQAGR